MQVAVPIGRKLWKGIVLELLVLLGVGLVTTDSSK